MNECIPTEARDMPRSAEEWQDFWYGLILSEDPARFKCRCGHIPCSDCLRIKECCCCARQAAEEALTLDAVADQQEADWMAGDRYAGYRRRVPYD